MTWVSRSLRRLLISSSVYRASTSCPNQCSGHGECTAENVCLCDTGWAYYADCSGRLCPIATAWVDKASAPGRAHGDMECGNIGVCNRNDAFTCAQISYVDCLRDFVFRGVAHAHLVLRVKLASAVHPQCY